MALSDLLESIFPRTAWAELAAYIAGQQINPSTLCATDPPAVPTFDALDVVSILTGTPTAFPTAFGKMVDLVEIAAWYTFCECTSVTTPAPPTPPVYPPNAPDINPNQIQPTTGQVCSDLTYNTTLPARPSGTLCTVLDQVVPGTPSVTVTQPTGSCVPAATLATALPGTVSQVRGVLDASWPAGQSIGASVGLELFDSTGTHITTVTPSWQTNDTSGSGHIDTTFAIPATASSWICFAGSESTIVSADIGFELIITCGNPNVPVQPCCPPDANMQGQLQAIINLLNQLLTATPALPAYRKGTVHSGLTGSGTIATTGLFGMLAEITTGAPTTPQLPGTPPYEWSVGWMSISTGDGMIQEIRFTRQHQLWAPELMPLATTFGYYVNTPFTVTFTELLPPATTGP